MCGECKRLLEDGRRFREQVSASLTTDGEQVRLPWSYYSIPYIKTPKRDHLQKAVLQLALVASRPSPHLIDEYDVPHLLERRDGNNMENQYVRVVPKGFTKAFQSLFFSIQQACDASYRDGKRDGSSVILQLASGDMSVSDFNDSTIGANEGADDS
ncbi:MAG TPA: hypothetical protein VF624_15835 [Tepidisphaeraceae bacterium]